MHDTKKETNEMRQTDEKIEREVGAFLDQYFYSKIRNKHFERIYDKAKQVRGIDVILGRSKIDEKVKLKGALNQIFGYPSFEIKSRNKNGDYFDGWFVNENYETDYYLFISVFSDTCNVESQIDRNNISQLNLLFLKKSEVKKLVVDDDIERDADILIDDSSVSFEDKLRKRYAHGLYWLTLSRYLTEAPVNLVIPRQTLERLDHSVQYNVTRDVIRKVGVR